MSTIGSLFSGYGGLDHAVEAVTGGRTIWRSDIDPGANKIIAHHWPDDPNLGDITAIDWASVESPYILAGGFPCQDVSAAGKRAGLIRYGEGNRSGLWAEMARAIDILRPSLVVAENVRGLLSAKADAHPDVFDCLACMADTSDKPMRALGAVLGDLAAIGYDAAWRVVRASDVGAPHQRARVFVIAWPTANAKPLGRDGWARQLGQGWRPEPANGSDDLALMPTPRAARGASGTETIYALGGVRSNDRRSQGDVLLPTPQVADATGGHASRSGERANELLLPGLARAYAAGTLLPTPAAADSERGSLTYKRGNPTLLGGVQPERWGKYADAVARWEALTRPAPEPTETGPRGGQRLSPAFVEWMMGLPAGHVTSPEIGLTRNEQLKALGNGVVPQQAEFGIRGLLADVAAVAA